MTELPQQLIKSLTSLGLLESEAKVYAALVVLKSAEVKDLLEFLNVSKPRIYDGLRMLEESGLIVLTSPRPVTYQAIAPSIALEMLVDRHNAAKKEAIKQFRDLENQDTAVKSSAPLWFIFGDKSFEFKIRDMIASAKESVDCVTSEKNLVYVETALNKNVKVMLMILSDNADVQNKLERSCRKSNVTITTIDKVKARDIADQAGAADEAEATEIANMFDIDNYFILVVDDSELLFVPPIKGDSINAISVANKALVRTFKRGLEKQHSDSMHNK